MIKGGNEHNYENAEHQILARATKFPTGLYLLFMYVKYEFQRKNTLTLDQVLAPNLNVQSYRQHQVLKIYKSPHLYMQICHVRVVAQILHPVPHRHPTLKVIYQIFQYLSFTNLITKYKLSCPTLSATVKQP